MAKTPAMKNKGDALVLQAQRGEPVNIVIGGKGAFRIVLQAEVGSPGSGSWRDVKSWSRKELDTDDIEYFYQNSDEEVQSLRLVIKEMDEKASIMASMEVPAEEEPQEPEPKLREQRSAELVSASPAEIEKQEKAKAEAESRVTSTSTTTSKQG